MTYSSMIVIRIHEQTVCLFVLFILFIFFGNFDSFDPKQLAWVVKKQPICKGKHISVVRRSGLICVVLYSLSSLIWHLFLRHPWYYDTFWHDQTFKFKTPSFIRPRHSIMRHLESPLCHVKEVVNAKNSFHLYYVHLTYIYFHLGTTWELHLPLGTQWELGLLVHNGHG